MNSIDYTAIAQVRNVAASNELTVTQNGNPIAFQFSPEDGSVQVPLSLQDGINTVSILARNAGGSDSKSVRITLANGNNATTNPSTEPADPNRIPRIIWVNPSGRMNNTSYSSTYRVQIRFENVTASSQIRFKLNGVNHVFGFDASTRTLETSIRPRTGDNYLFVEVNTSNGHAEDSAQLYHDLTSNSGAPLLNVLNPARRNSTVNQDRITLQAEVRNVSSNEEIEVIHNNNVVSFSYDPVTFRMTCPLQLTVGINPITITVTTPNGREQEQLVINYQPEPTPGQTESTPRSGGGQSPNRGSQIQEPQKKVEESKTPKTPTASQRPVKPTTTEPTTRPSQSATPKPTVKEPVRTAPPVNNAPSKPKADPSETPKPKMDKPAPKTGGE